MKNIWDKDNIPSLGQKSEHEVWIRGLDWIRDLTSRDWYRKINSKVISYCIQKQLVLRLTQTYVLIFEWDQRFYASLDQSFRILFPYAVPQTALVQITLVSIFARLPLYLPLCICSMICWPVYDCTICLPPILNLQLADLHMTKPEFHLFILSILLRLK